MVYFLTKKYSVKKVGKLVVLGLIILFFFIIIVKYTEMGEILLHYIGERLERMFTQKITGNRFSDEFNAFYDSSIKGKINNYFFGLGSVEYNQLSTMFNFRSAGYKVYIAQNGIVNTILVFLFYGLQMRIDKYSYNRKLYLIWILSFISIAYPTWACFLIFVVCGSINSINSFLYNSKCRE